MTKITVLDLFSGIGGFSLGLQRTGGFETVAFCEIEPYCQKVLAKHWPGVPCHDDVTTYPFREGEADVITAGFPCQDISFAGEGAGLAGSRSGLYREVVRAVRMVRPKFAVLENVAALLGRGLGTVLGDLAEVGYDAEWHCIPASAVGAPHRRDRIWIVAYPGRFDCNGRGGECGGSEEAGSCDWPARSSEHAINVADALGAGLEGRRFGRTDVAEADGTFARCLPGGIPAAPVFADAIGRQLSQRRSAGRVGRQEPVSWDGDWPITSEPVIRRGTHGVSHRVDRLKGLGNAVVPQIPELIGRAILAARAVA